MRRTPTLLRASVLLAALPLASCTSTSVHRQIQRETDLDGWARTVAWADSLRYVDPQNRVRSDAGLVYEYPACASYTFDSSSGTLVRRISNSLLHDHDAIRADLTPAQFDAVVAEADRIGLWSYPADFGDAETLALGPSGRHSRVAIASPYRLDLRAGGRSASVRWSGSILEPLSERAVGLRALARAIESFIGADAAYDRFPFRELAGGCL